MHCTHHRNFSITNATKHGIRANKPQAKTVAGTKIVSHFFDRMCSRLTPVEINFKFVCNGFSRDELAALLFVLVRNYTTIKIEK